MSKRILITFGGRAYDEQIGRQRAWHVLLSTRAIIDEHRVYDDRWLLGTPFYQLNRWIFDRQPQHGFGFCCWKPFIIQHALHNFAQEGDVVMYLDGDTYPIADISCLFERAEREGVMLFEEQGCVNKTWIKGECFETMGFLRSEGYVKFTGILEDRGPWEAMIACGRFQLFKKSGWLNEQFLQEWLAYSLTGMCMFHEGSYDKRKDDCTFIRNSCEQSVLSLLAHKYAIPLHRNPDQSGWPVAHDGKYKPEDTYPQLFIQDGRRGDIKNLSGSRYRNV